VVDYNHQPTELGVGDGKGRQALSQFLNDQSISLSQAKVVGQRHRLVVEW